MKGLKIYFIEAVALYPVCDAGAVVIAKNPEEALELTSYLDKPSTPTCIGYAGKKYKKSQVIYSNNGDY